MTRRHAFTAAFIGCLFVAGLTVQFRPWNWPWRSAWGDLSGRSGLVLAFFAAGLATAWLMSLRRAKLTSRTQPTGDTWPWLLSYPGMTTLVVVVLAVGVIALSIMMDVASGATKAEKPKLQIEAIKYGLGIFAGAGAVAALLVGVRRQRHTELAHDDTVFTDLYTKAADQLGHADAAVRLAGLYALERVAQNNLGQRQTIVNVICAYLRMPYTPPDPENTGGWTPELPLGIPDPPDGARDPYQELQVRLTAQQILIAHLTQPDGPSPADQGSRFWPGTDVDLSGAALVNWRFPRGNVRGADFSRAIFSGDALFTDAHFSADASFDGAVFTGVARFGGVAFAAAASFDEAAFAGMTSFDKAAFSAGSSFSDASFSGVASFTGAAFSGIGTFRRAVFLSDAWFDRTTFAKDATFDRMECSMQARFDGVAFSGRASFAEAAFTSDASFPEAVFARNAVFTDARFGHSAWFGRATFAGEARFNEVLFARRARFDRSSFARDASFNDAAFSGGAWFTGAVFAGEARFFKAVFAEDVWFSDVTFTGAARFDDARFLGSVDLTRSRLGTDPRDDVWPTG